MLKEGGKIQDGRFENSVAQISAYTHGINEIPTATPMFPGSGDTYRLLGIQFHVWSCWNTKMTTINWKKIGNYVYLSSYIYDSNKIPTATPLFLGSGNTDTLLGILSYVRVCWKSKMGAINRK